jgi:hypothetical protein
MSVEVDCLDTFDPPKPWDLFGKHAMKLGIDAVSVDCDRNETAYRLSMVRAATLTRHCERTAIPRAMALTDGSNQRSGRTDTD